MLEVEKKVEVEHEEHTVTEDGGSGFEESMSEQLTVESAQKIEPTRLFCKEMLPLNLACLLGFLNSTINGYDGSLMNALLSNEWFRDFFGSSNVGVRAGILTGMYQVGGVSALVFVGPLTDTWGRRVGMLIGAIIIMLGTIIAATTSINPSLGQFLAGRFFLGFGYTVCASAGPTYVVEISHPAFRGVQTGIYNTFYYTGSILAAGVVRGSLNQKGNQSWLIPLWLQMLFPGLIAVFSWLLPESPRWLYAHNRENEANKFLVKYHGKGKKDSIWVKLQLEEYQDYLKINGSDQKWWDYRALFSTRASLYRVMCSVTVSILAQWAGNGLISYYLSGVLDTAGITDTTKQLNINLGIACMSLVCAVAGATCVDVFGRRTMLLYVNQLLALCWMAMVICTAMYNEKDLKSAAQATIAMIYIFSAVFSVGYSAIQGLYPVEVLSFEIRAKGMAVSSLAVNASSLLISYGMPVALQKIQWKTYIILMVWCVIQALIVYAVIPETKGWTLEELDEIFASKNPVKASLKTSSMRDLEKGRMYPIRRLWRARR